MSTKEFDVKGVIGAAKKELEKAETAMKAAKTSYEKADKDYDKGRNDLGEKKIDETAMKAIFSAFQKAEKDYQKAIDDERFARRSYEALQAFSRNDFLAYASILPENAENVLTESQKAQIEGKASEKIISLRRDERKNHISQGKMFYAFHRSVDFSDERLKAFCKSFSPAIPVDTAKDRIAKYSLFLAYGETLCDAAQSIRPRTLQAFLENRELLRDTSVALQRAFDNADGNPDKQRDNVRAMAERITGTQKAKRTPKTPVGNPSVTQDKALPNIRGFIKGLSAMVETTAHEKQYLQLFNLFHGAMVNYQNAIGKGVGWSDSLNAEYQSAIAKITSLLGEIADDTGRRLKDQRRNGTTG